MPDFVGTNGNDTISGTADRDWIQGLKGDDVLNGMAGGDTLDGGDGVDLLEGRENDDILIGGDGADDLRGGEGGDVLYGDQGVLGSTDNFVDSLQGEGGNDTAYIGAGDVFNGGSGSDLVIVSFVASSIGITLNLAGDPEADLETAAGVTLTSVESFGVYGSTHADTVYGQTTANDLIYGAGGDDILQGMGGNDTLYGGSGDDTLSGGAGVDVLYGGLGDDRYLVDDSTDTIVEGVNQGIERVFTELSYTLGVNLENLQLNGAASVNGDGNGLDNDIFGNSAANILSGHDGADSLYGNDGEDQLFGGAGDDRLFGQLGADHMVGGLGDDQYFVTDAGDVVVEAAGEGRDGVVASFAYTLGGHIESLRLADAAGAADGAGNALANTVQGNDAANVLSGHGGDDDLSGHGGDDTLYGGDGADILRGGAGSDMLFGGDGDDTISYLSSSAGVTVNLLNGTVGSGGDATGDAYTSIESIVGSHQADDLTGDGNANVFEGAGGADTIDGVAGEDTVSYAFSSSVTINLTTGINTGNHAAGDVLLNIVNVSGSAQFGDSLTGDGAVNRLWGLGGNDVLNGAGGNDVMTGGAGDDVYHVGNSGDQTIELAGEGTDTVETALAAYTLRANIENGEMKGAGHNSMTGNALNNVLRGNAGNNILDGGSGGADDFHGGAGNDTYHLNSTSDRVFELAGEGYDTVHVNNNFSVGTQEIEEVVLSGTLARNLTGGAGDNILRGNGSNNVLDGGAGADTLYGGAGDDTYYVERAADVVVELAGQGVDTVHASNNHTLAANVENGIVNATGNRILTGNALDNSLTGNIGDDTLTGDGGNDVLNGGAGIDTMTGGTGDDTYYVERAGDVVVELTGQGIDTVYASNHHTLAANVENGVVNATGNRILTGNELGNSLSGNIGNDTLTGGLGADILTGGAGADQFDFNAVSDTAWAAYDTITDLEATDVIDLSGIDANDSLAGDQAFVLVSAFTGVAGQLRLIYSAATGDTYVAGDVNGDGVGDFRIRLTGDHRDYDNFVL